MLMRLSDKKSPAFRPGSLFSPVKSFSVASDDRSSSRTPAEAVVQAARTTWKRVSASRRAVALPSPFRRRLVVGCVQRLLVSEIDVQILSLEADVVGERILKTGAERPTSVLLLVFFDRPRAPPPRQSPPSRLDRERSGALHVAVGPAAGDVEQSAIPAVAEASANRAEAGDFAASGQIEVADSDR